MALRADDVDLGRDRVLVEQYQEGDLAAFEDLYRRYYGRLFRFCLRRTGNPHEAEELTQEAFARAYRAMPMLRGERRFYPWLSVIASRLCIDSHRRTGRTEPTAEVDPGSVSDADRIDAAFDHDLLNQALGRLTDRHREVLHLREREGWSYQRIAEHYDISMGAVEGLLFRARQALRREFISVAGPEAGLAGGIALPLGGLGGLGGLPVLGRLLRRFDALRMRAGEWAADWGMGMSGLAANSMGLAMVITTVAGFAGAVVSPAAPRPVMVVAAEHASASAPAESDEAAAAPVAPVVPVGVTRTERAPAASPPKAPSAGAPLAPAAGPVDPQLHVVSGDEGRQRAEDKPFTIPTPNGQAVAGVDPSKIAKDTADAAEFYAAQARGEQK